MAAEVQTQKRHRIPDNIMSSDSSTKMEVANATSPSFINLMRKTSAEHLRPQEGKIFIAQRTDKIADVWKGLVQHNFMSVPVLQKKGTKYYGFLDLADIVKFVVEQFGGTKLKIEKDFWEFTKREEYFQKRIVNDLMIYPLSKRNPFHPIHKGFSLLFVAELLAKEPNLHRVPILDDNNLITGLITASHLLKFAFQNINMLGDVKSKTLDSFVHALPSPVISVKLTDTAIEAFQLMLSKNVHGLAVVDAEGVLVDTLSVKDLKVIHSDTSMFWRLFQDLDTFLKKLKVDFPESRPKNVVSAKPTDTLETVLRYCAEAGIHRVFVVDANKKPTHVVTAKEILREILDN